MDYNLRMALTCVEAHEIKLLDGRIKAEHAHAWEIAKESLLRRAESMDYQSVNYRAKRALQMAGIQRFNFDAMLYDASNILMKRVKSDNLGDRILALEDAIELARSNPIVLEVGEDEGHWGAEDAFSGTTNVIKPRGYVNSVFNYVYNQDEEMMMRRRAGQALRFSDVRIDFHEWKRSKPALWKVERFLRRFGIPARA